MWPKYWSFSFNISPSNEYPRLIYFRMEWLNFFAVQGTLMSILQHHTPKASILHRSAFFIAQLSHPYTTTRETIALTRGTFVGKVMSLLLNMLPRLVITFLPRNKRLLISWLQSPSAVILEPPPKNSATVSTVFSSICHEVMGPDASILFFWMLSFKPTFSFSSFTFIKRLFSSSSLSAIKVVSSAYLSYWYFCWQSWFQFVLPPAQRFSWCTLHTLVAQTVKHLPTMRDTRVQSLGQEDPLEKEMATHSSTLAWKIPWTEEPGRLQSMGSQRVGHD